MRSPEATDLRRHQTITLSLLFIAGVVNFFDRASLSVANNTVRAELHLSATEMGWLLSAFSLAYGFSQLPLIGVMRRIGGRWALGGGLGLWSAAQMLTGMVRGLPAFLVFRVLLGMGESPFYPAGVQSLRVWFPAESRARATALMNMSSTLALAAAPPALTWIMLAAGWRAMFELLGAVGLVVAVAWCLLYRARDGEAAAVESAWRVLLRQRTVWGMMLGFGGVNYTVWLYVAWIPGYLQTARHLSLARTGWVAAVPFLFGAAGMAASGVFTDLLVRRGARPVVVHRMNLIVGMVLSAAGTFVVVRSASTAMAVGGISAALFFIHFAGTSGWGYAQAIGGVRHSASLGALQNFASFTIASAAPVLTGWLLDRTQSFTLSLEACSAVTLLGALSYATLGRPSAAQTAE
jgi:predicted MFS family arabinose efflux permease